MNLITTLTLSIPLEGDILIKNKIIKQLHGSANEDITIFKKYAYKNE